MKNYKLNSTLVMAIFMTIIVSFTANAGTISTIDVDYNTVGKIEMSGSYLYTTKFDLSVNSDQLGLTDYTTFGYCVEPTQGISRNSYDFDLVSLGDTGSNSDSHYQAAWLMSTYSDVTGKNEVAALQGVIWELITDSAYEVASSTKVDTYKNALSTLTLTEGMKASLSSSFMVAQNAAVQDLLVAVPNSISASGSSSSPVPEPTTMLLFGVGLASLAAGGRKRK